MISILGKHYLFFEDSQQNSIFWIDFFYNITQEKSSTKDLIQSNALILSIGLNHYALIIDKLPLSSEQGSLGF